MRRRVAGAQVRCGGNQGAQNTGGGGACAPLLLEDGSDQREFDFSPAHRTLSSPHAAQVWRAFDPIGIAIGRAQAQYPMGAMFSGAK